MKLLKISQVVEKTSLSKSVIYDLITKGFFPKQYQIPHTTTARWLESDIEDYIEAIVRPANNQDKKTTTASA